jgi:NADPH:quinone reductase-like Zn-dependent oxidoreductase
LVPHRFAVGAGYTVATTAGAHNHAYVKSLGATYCFGHKDPKVVDNIAKLLKAGDVVFDSIGEESSQKAAQEVVSRVGGGKLPTVLWPLPTEYDNVEPVLGTF